MIMIDCSNILSNTVCIFLCERSYIYSLKALVLMESKSQKWFIAVDLRVPQPIWEICHCVYTHTDTDSLLWLTFLAFCTSHHFLELFCWILSPLEANTVTSTYQSHTLRVYFFCSVFHIQQERDRCVSHLQMFVSPILHLGQLEETVCVRSFIKSYREKKSFPF